MAMTGVYHRLSRGLPCHVFSALFLGHGEFPNSFSPFASRMTVVCSHVLLGMADHRDDCSLVPSKQLGGHRAAWLVGWVVSD